MPRPKRSAMKEEFWRKALARFKSSGLSRAKFCQGEGFNVHTFDYWRVTLAERDREVKRAERKPRDAAPDFVPVVVTQDMRPAAEPNIIAEIAFCGGSMRLLSGIDSELVREIVRTLQEAAR